MRTCRVIAVVGGSGGVTQATLKHARELGAAIIRDAILLTGGDGRDSQTAKDAAVVGAREELSKDAPIVSILQKGGGLQERDGTIRSGIGHGRNILNATGSDAMIVLPGGAGTLSEAAFARMFERRIILFGGAKEALEKALLVADVEAIVDQSKVLRHVLPSDCTAATLRKNASDALNSGLTTDNVQTAVSFAKEAPLAAFLPELEGIDPATYQRLLEHFDDLIARRRDPTAVTSV